MPGVIIISLSVTGTNTSQVHASLGVSSSNNKTLILARMKSIYDKHHRLRPPVWSLPPAYTINNADKSDFKLNSDAEFHIPP